MTCANGLRSERRLLILEFVTRERWVYNSRFFPFVKGAAEKLGIPVRWISFGADVRTEKTTHTTIRQHMHLDEADRATLARHVDDFRPTHVLLSDPVSEEVEDLLIGPAPGAALLTTSDLPGHARLVSIFQQITRTESRRRGTPLNPGEGGFEPQALVSRTDWVLDWLGENLDASPDAGRFLIGTFYPSYDVVLGNDRLREYKPHLLIMGGITCDHARPVKDVAAYRDMDLSECLHDFGCAFCTHYRGSTGDPTIDPVKLAEEQLRRVVETTAGRGRDCGVFDVFDVRLFRQIDRFLQMVLDVGVPPSQFCFEPRVDRFLEVADRLESVLPRFAAAGHTVCLFRMGGETLVEEENRFYNKGVTLDDLDRATARQRELAQKFPGAFDFDPTYGYISCSPWTSFEQYARGIRLAVERGFAPKDIWLYTPLLLYRNAPITKLALREGGIVQDDVEDLSQLYEPAVNQVPFDSFLRWRFKDSRTGVAFALVVRFCAAAMRDKYPDTLFQDDDLYRDMLARDPGETLWARPDLFALEVVGVVEDAAPPFDRNALLERAIARYEAVLRALPPPPDAGPQRTDYGQSERSKRLRKLVDAVVVKLGGTIGDLAVTDARDEPDAARIRLDVACGQRPYRLLLTASATTDRAVLKLDRLAVAHARETPLSNEADRKAVFALVAVLDRALGRYAPDLVPGAVTGSA